MPLKILENTLFAYLHPALGLAISDHISLFILAPGHLLWSIYFVNAAEAQIIQECHSQVAYVLVTQWQHINTFY